MFGRNLAKAMQNKKIPTWLKLRSRKIFSPEKPTWNQKIQIWKDDFPFERG